MRSLTIAVALWPCFALAEPTHSPRLLEQPLFQEIEQRAIAYFIDNAHPHTGLVLDRSFNFIPNRPENRIASMAATGFGITVLANAAKRGIVDFDFAQAYIEKVLKFSQENVPRHNGWFLHFVDWETGASAWSSEYSTIDSALFIAGALYAAQIYPNTELARLANQLYVDLDFHDIMTDGGAQPQKRTLSMGYLAGLGYISTQWHMYAEQMILLLLGLGHPTNPLPVETWAAFDRSLTTLPSGSTAVMGVREALFVHQYSQLFVDFRNLQDGYTNYFRNSVEVSRLHRDIGGVDTRFLTLREGFWGFSAGDAPGGGYEVYTPVNYQSTVCIGCAVGSLAFMPEEISTDIQRWRTGPYAERLFGRYGFVDSLDLDRDWFSPWVLGITVGPIYMSLANTEENTAVWQDFMNIPAMQSAFQRIGQFNGQILSAVPSDEMIEPGTDFLDRTNAEPSNQF